MDEHLGYLPLPKLTEFPNDYTDILIKENVRLLKWMATFGLRIRPLRGWKEINSLPLNTILFDSIIRQSVALRVIGFKYTHDDPRSVEVKVKTVVGNLKHSLIINDVSAKSYLVCVAPPHPFSEEMYGLAKTSARTIQEMDSPANWSLGIANGVYSPHAKDEEIRCRKDSSLLLLGENTIKRISAEWEKKANDASSQIKKFAGEANGAAKVSNNPPPVSGDIVSDIIRLGGSFEYIKEMEDLKKIPMFTVMRCGGHYVRVVKISISEGYMSLFVRTIKGNLQIGSKHLDSIVTEVSFVNYFTAKRGTQYITAPPTDSFDPAIVEHSSNNYTLILSQPLTSTPHRQWDSTLFTYSRDRQANLFSPHHTQASYFRTSKPVFLVFNSEGTQIKAGASDVR